MKCSFKYLWPHCVKFIPVAKILNNALSIYVLGCVISTLDNILLANLSCSLFFSWLQIWRCLVGSMHKIRHDHHLIKIVSFDIWQLKVFIKFIYSEKATKFCEIFILILTVCTVVKSKVKISQTFVAFLEYMIFKSQL